MSKRHYMRSARVRYGFNQAELATVAGISTPTVSMWETDKSDPSLLALESVCDALGMTLTEYVTGNTVEPPKTAQRGAEAATMRRNRENAKLKQSTLAKLAGVSVQALWSYENNAREPRLSAMQKLAAALDMTIDEYVGFAPRNA